MAGDHDAFSELARVSIGRLYVVARLILRDDKGCRGRDPGGTRGRLAPTRRPARSRRSRPGSIACWSTRAIAKHAGADGGGASRSTSNRSRCRKRRGHPTGTSTWPIAINSSAASDASTWISERCSSCTTTSGSASMKPRTPRCSTRDGPLPSPSRDQCDASRPRGRCPTPDAQRRTVGMTSRTLRATNSTGSCAWRTRTPASASPSTCSNRCSRRLGSRADFLAGSLPNGGSPCNSRCRCGRFRESPHSSY